MGKLKDKDSFLEKINIQRKQELAEKLKIGEVDIDDLNDDEIDEMIQFFKESMKQKDLEIEQIKHKIIEMRRIGDNNI